MVNLSPKKTDISMVADVQNVDKNSQNDGSSSNNVAQSTSRVVAHKCYQNESKPIVHGSFNQADARFSEISRGSQCTANALSALLFAKYSNLHTSTDLDNVLLFGNQLYLQIISDLKKSKRYVHNLLCFEDLPSCVEIFSKEICISKGDVISGCGITQFGNNDLPTLHTALQRALAQNQSVLIIIGSICSAVFVLDNLFYFFDSHSHGSDGLSAADGTSLLIAFSIYEDLIAFMYACYESMLIDLSIQFDVMPLSFHDVKVVSKSYDTTEHTPSLLNNYFKDQLSKSVEKSYSKQPLSMPMTSSNSSITRQNTDSNTNTHETRLLKSNKKRVKATYCRKQVSSNDMDSCNSNIHKKTQNVSKLKATHKKEYMKNYMKLKRQDKLYREKELKRKQMAREDKIFSEKEKESDLRIKRLARQDENFKEKERENKRSSRLDKQFRGNEKERELQIKRSARQNENFKEKERENKRSSRLDLQFRGIEKERELQTKRSARENENFKEKERENKRSSRLDKQFREKEREHELQTKRSARHDEQFKEKERENKRSSRLDKQFREKENDRELQTKRSARQDEHFKEKERENKRVSRLDKQFREKERECELQTKRSARQDEPFKEKEREQKRSSRLDKQFRGKEKERELQTKRSARQDEPFREKERENKRCSRLDKQFRGKERDRELQTKRSARQHKHFKEKERENKRIARQNEQFRQKEKMRELISKKNTRKRPIVLEQERVMKQQWRSRQKNKAVEVARDKHRKAMKRKTDDFNKKEFSAAHKRKSGKTIEQCIERFHDNISVGPVYVCSCCHQTWFKESVLSTNHIHSEMKQTYLTGFKSVDDKEWICHTCNLSLRDFKTPKLSLANGMKWPVQPNELQLFPLEERLVSLRIPFMQIRELPRGGQYSLKGNVVNVPVNIQPTVSALPRPLDENITVAVKLKRKISFQSCVYTENIRPLRVLVALHWLMQHSTLYKNSNIEIDQTWIKQVTESDDDIAKEFVSRNTGRIEHANDSLYQSDDTNEQFENASNNSLPLEINLNTDNDNEEAVSNEDGSKNGKSTHNCKKQVLETSQCVVNESNIETCKNNIDVASNVGDKHDTMNCPAESVDSDTEDAAIENVGNIDTLLNEENEQSKSNQTYTFAPGEGQHPLSLYQDVDSEYLCFPTIFCGQRRPQNNQRRVPVYYSDIAKWELRSLDRRAAQSVPNIFFKLKKIQLKQINDKVQLALRKCKTQEKPITAAEIRNPTITEQFVRKDEGYFIFKQLRNSPAYLESRKKDVFAMIRQLGLPTWFMSLSAADSRWTDLLKMLKKLNDNVEYTDQQISDMTWVQKVKLVQKDPVTCTRYFDFRVQHFIRTVLKSCHEPIGKVLDFFYRVEFQQRGSPHIHMLVWIENAPKYGRDSDDKIVEYVDTFLTCSTEENISPDLIGLQIHKHSKTCKKKKDKECRFGYPLPPLNKTMILEPLVTEVEKYKKKYDEIQKIWNQNKDDYATMSFSDFLVSVVKMSEQEYIKCICSSLNGPKVFLKRNPKQMNVNLFNQTILRAWKANLDIQYVLDPYACAMYIVSYISKSHRGMSSLLNSAATEARNGNLDVKRQVRHIGNAFSNSVEVGAQEAVYLVLQIPLTKSSREVVFINTSQAGERIRLIKSQDLLDELPADSTDIISDNVIQRYSRRPKQLENWCLADYVSQLEVVYPKQCDKVNDVEEINDDSFAEQFEHEQCEFSQETTVLKLKNGIKIRKRKNNRIIRYVRFNAKKDEENYYREKLLLFLPWRDENKLTDNFETFKERFLEMRHFVEHKCKEYEHNAEQLEEAMQQAIIDHNDAFDEIAPNAQQENADAEDEGSLESDTFYYFNPDRVIEHRNYDIGIELGTSCALPNVENSGIVLSDANYRGLLQTLNSKQREFHNHIVHWIKTKTEPSFTFLSGGAGVGKSVLIKALYQTLYRILNLKEGENPDDTRILLCAFTGKAAFNINGVTIASAFHKKYMQNNHNLSCDELNTFRMKYRNLRVIIIDEISMVGNGLLNFIDQRLQELTGSKRTFGGITVVAVGDLYQLMPVGDSWIFNDLKRGSSALAPNLWKQHFKIFELVEIMRQKDDVYFAQLLNRLRHNTLTDEDRIELKKHEISVNTSTYPSNAPHLFTENKFVDNYNTAFMEKLEGQKVTIPCNDTLVAANISKENCKRLVNAIPDDASKTANLMKNLTVAVGMIYDISVNVNVEDGLTNGSTCEVKHVEYKMHNTNRPSILWVLFHDAKIGEATRKQFTKRGYYNDMIQPTWTPIFDIERTFLYNFKTFQRIQFPLKPSAGKTIHKAQGCTVDEIVVDLSQTRIRKIPHIHYVALSRVRTLQNLHILNFNEKALTIDEKVTDEMTRLRNTAKLQLCYKPLYELNSVFKVAFNNCRSLHKHFKDVTCEPNLLSADVIGIAESRLCSRDLQTDYCIPGFKTLRNDQNTHLTRPHHGLVLYLKDTFNIVQQQMYSSDELEFIYLRTCEPTFSDEYQLVILYKSPRFQLSKLISCLNKELLPLLLKNVKTIIIGDFNLDCRTGNKQFLSFMKEQCGCSQLLSCTTTDYETMIDLVFANSPVCTGVIEAYWSDHNIVYCCVEK